MQNNIVYTTHRSPKLITHLGLIDGHNFMYKKITRKKFEKHKKFSLKL